LILLHSGYRINVVYSGSRRIIEVTACPSI
jgi:hypothetical protein